MKVYLDENLSPGIATILRAEGVDATSAHEVGNRQLDDRAQLAYATAEGRALVTANVVDFLALAALTVRANAEHAGIVLVPSSFQSDDFAAIARAVVEVVRRYPAGVGGAVIYLARSD